jgi:hypothetical protein
VKLEIDRKGKSIRDGNHLSKALFLTECYGLNWKVILLSAAIVDLETIRR